VEASSSLRGKNKPSSKTGTKGTQRINYHFSQTFASANFVLVISVWVVGIMISRRNSFLNDIKEEQSNELHASNLNLEFQDSDDDGSITLGFSDAMVGDDELQLQPTASPRTTGISESVGSFVDDETGHEDLERDVTQSKEKSIVEKIGKRTSVASKVTLVLILCLGLGALLGSLFISRHEDCQYKRDEVRIAYNLFHAMHNQCKPMS
jgi:hypothetical protein